MFPRPPGKYIPWGRPCTTNLTIFYELNSELTYEYRRFYLYTYDPANGPAKSVCLIKAAGAQRLLLSGKFPDPFSAQSIDDIYGENQLTNQDSNEDDG